MTFIESLAMSGIQITPGDSTSPRTLESGDEDLAIDSLKEQTPSFASAYQQAQDAADKGKVDAKVSAEASPDAELVAAEIAQPAPSLEETDKELTPEREWASTSVLENADKANAPAPSATSIAPMEAQNGPVENSVESFADANQDAAGLTESDFYQQLFAQLNTSTELKTPDSADLVKTGLVQETQAATLAVGAVKFELKALPPQFQQAMAQLTPAQREQLSAQVLQFAQEQNLEPKHLAALTQQLEGWVGTPKAASLLGTQGESKELSVQAKPAPDKSDPLMTKAPPADAVMTPDSKNASLAANLNVTVTASADKSASASADEGAPVITTSSLRSTPAQSSESKAQLQSMDKAPGANVSPELGKESIESASQGRLEPLEGGKLQQLAQALLAQLVAGTQQSSGTHANGLGDINTAMETDLAQWQQVAAPASVQAQAAPQGSGLKQVLDPALMQALNITKSDAALQLHQRVNMLLNLSNQEAEIRLDPPELGSMQVRVRSEGEQAHINFVVQNQQAKEALEQSMPRLRELLAQQGLALGEAQVQQQSQGQSQQQESFANQTHQGVDTDIQGENDDALEAVNTRAKNPQAEQGIDFYA